MSGKSPEGHKQVYTDLSLDACCALRHVAADLDISVPRLLRKIVTEFLANRVSEQQYDPGDFSDTVSNGEAVEGWVQSMSRVEECVKNQISKLDLPGARDA
jgi:hypothetical protein